MKAEALVVVAVVCFMTCSLARASDWNCNKAKDGDVITKAGPNIREYKKEHQGSGLHAMAEVVTLVDGTVLNFDHNGCKTLADGVEKPQYEARIRLKEGLSLPQGPNEAKWFDVAVKVLSDTGLCEKSRAVTSLWCEKLKQQSLNAKFKKEADDMFVWRASLQKNKFGEEETLVFSILPKPRMLRLGNTVLTESDSAD